MNVEKIEKVEYEIYEKSINIELFNKIISFIINTRNSKETATIVSNIMEKCIWYDKVDSTDFQEKYNFQYLGELLERYEERAGNNIEDIRAITLALGYGKNLIEKNMIIGTQLVDFLSKIKKLANDDIYLQGALYLCDNEKYNIYAEELMNRTYDKTEDIIFAFSIFYERIEDFFRKYRSQSIRLLGKEKTISVIGNIGLYAWLIKNLYSLINEDRKKDIALLKALIKVPTGFQKENTSIYKELINNGYRKEEIIYLNYLILYYDTVPKSIRLRNSIVEEKIAIYFCEIFINDEKPHKSNIYQLIKLVLQKYKNFDIKCYGYSKIKDALSKKINIINPITFVELYDEFDGELFSFDILDEKWDIVAYKCKEHTYEKIMDTFLYFSKYKNEKLVECIKKYDKLTGMKYIESFFEKDYDRQNTFEFLVDNNVILLKDFFEYIEKNNKMREDSHLSIYIRGIRKRKAFEFLKYLIRLNRYSMKEINGLGFEFETLFNTYYSYNLDIDRSFLNIKEQKFLFNCIEQYVFYVSPSKYFSFLEATLKYPKVMNLLQKKDLKQLYLELCEINPETYKKEWLQEKYLTSEEMNEIRNQKKIKIEFERVQEIIEKEHSVDEEFEKAEKQSFKQLYNFCDRYYSIKLQFSIKKVKEYLYNNLSSFEKDNKEMIYFMKILQLFLKENEMTMVEVTKMIYEYMKEEVKKNGYFINESFKNNN